MILLRPQLSSKSRPFTGEEGVISGFCQKKDKKKHKACKIHKYSADYLVNVGRQSDGCRNPSFRGQSKKHERRNNMNAKRNLFVTFVAAMLTLVMTAGWHVMANSSEPPKAWQVSSLEGGWNITSPDLSPGAFVVGLYSAEDLRTGRLACYYQGIGMDPTMGLFIDAQSLSPFIGTAVRTGSNTFRMTAVAYATQTQDPAGLVAWIWMLNHEKTLIDTDTMEWSGTLSFYSAIEHPGHMLGDLPDQDKDDDGRPDEGEEPVFCVPMSGRAYRVMPMPFCEPTPMP